jgi:fatty acid-binding protein DegV
MNDFVIVTDSASDLPAWLVEELDVQVVPLSFIVEDQTYLNYPDNREMSPEEFYAKLEAGSMPTTITRTSRTLTNFLLIFCFSFQGLLIYLWLF